MSTKVAEVPIMQSLGKKRDDTKRQLLRHFLKDGFANDDELHFYIKEFLGYNIPRGKVCAECDPPFSFLADLYFERTSNALGFATRTGGKTMIVAILNHLQSTFHRQVEIASAGATLDQATKVYRNFMSLYESEYLKDQLVHAIQSYCKTASGSIVETITGTVRGVNSPHPNKARLDEIELMDWEVLQEALSMPVSKTNADGRLIKAQLVLTSTRKYGHGVMQRLLREAKQRRIRTYKWCIMDVVEKCTRKCFKDKKYGDCPAWSKCKGLAHKGTGWYKIEDFIDKACQLDEDVWNAQWRNKSPSSEARVYSKLREDVHLIDESDLERMFGVREIPKHWSRRGGLDLGTVAAFEQIAIEPTTNTYIVCDEVYETDILMRDLTAKIKALPTFQPGQNVYVDPAAKQERLELEQVYEFPNLPANNSFTMGRDALRRLIEVDPKLGRPRFFILKKRCPGLAGEVFDYSHPKFPDGTVDTTQAIKMKDHACDGCRYGTYAEDLAFSYAATPALLGNLDRASYADARNAEDRDFLSGTDSSEYVETNN